MFNFFLEHKSSLDHKKITNEGKVYFIGGFIFLLGILFFEKLSLISLIYIFVYCLGLASDKNKLNSPKIRFLLQIVIVVFTVVSYDLYINSTKIVFVDELLNYDIFKIFFSCFCLMILINGSNFIDGINLNLVGYYLGVLLTILFLSSNSNLVINIDLTYIAIILLLLIFVLNLSCKIISGDSGAYTYGIFFGIYLIQFSNDNPAISPIFIALLLWYPAFENLFSILRKKRLNISPLNPDFKHLHQLIFFKLNTKKINNKNLRNNLSGLILNLYNYFIFYLSVNYIYNSQILSILIVLNITIYLKTYFSLSK